MADLLADSGQLAGFSGTLTSHAAELEIRVSVLKRRAEIFFSADWSGVASDEMRQTFERWFQGVQGVHEALTGLGSFVNVSATSYEVTETNLTAAAQATQSVLGLPARTVTSSASYRQIPVD